jgi:hypothetical protein
VPHYQSKSDVKKKDGNHTPLVITKGAPLYSYEVRDHKGLSLTLWLWSPICAPMFSVIEPCGVLEEYRLIVGDKDKVFRFLGV